MLNIIDKQLTETKNIEQVVKIQENKFIRRNDLTPFIRLTIAYTALVAMYEKQRGVITKLAEDFLISRTFVYMLANSLLDSNQNYFSTMYPPAITCYESSIPHILHLRLAGKCSIESISSYLKRFDIKNSSAGYISQVLNNIGSKLPDTLSLNEEDSVKVVFASDEIFSKNSPILVTVDPISTAILKMELSDKRTAEDWINHWKIIEDNGCIPVSLVSDEGTGLVKGHSEYMSDLIRQPDTYHAVAHVLGVWDKRLEKQAYDAIEKEYDTNVVFKSEIDEKKFTTLTQKYEANKKNAQEKIEAYENFHYLYTCILSELDVFDENGNLRNRKNAENNIEACLDLLEHEIGLKKPVKKIRRISEDLLNYFDVADVILEELLIKIPNLNEEGLKALCLAWQWGKKRINAKKTDRKKRCGLKEIYYYELSELYISNDFEKLKNQVLKELNEIVQSSSIVECINSIIRPYLNNTKNQITQETLNLIMYYHNHRIYNAGKRKGKAPYEILTETVQTKDWLDLLIEEYEKNSH